MEADRLNELAGELFARRLAEVLVQGLFWIFAIAIVIALILGLRSKYRRRAWAVKKYNHSGRMAGEHRERYSPEFHCCPGYYQTGPKSYDVGWRHTSNCALR